MPFLKITRDKRGYENTCVMHSTQSRGKRATRILYWFRSPPDVKVGRGPLDEEAIRLIEETHPGVHFDWAHILRTASAGKQPSKARTGGSRRGQPFSGRREVAEAVVPAQEPAAPFSESELDENLTTSHPAASEDVGPRHAIGTAGAAEAVLGSSGLARLRVLYAELLARITQRVSDPGIQAKLRAEAELLNPETWVTDEDVRLRLETFEASFEALRAKLEGRRRRSRRGGAARRRRQQASKKSGESAVKEPTTPSGDGEPQS